ncbi:hypothetical protein EJ110_NYTH47500 [Nymphaea thermarum]|nr:hypothetical protein EJ110_NYTH47500 [Nymphaea thermarum]
MLLITDTGIQKVNEFLTGAGTDAPEVDEEIAISRPSISYDDMWAKTLLETSEAEEDDARSSGASSPESTGSIESSISSHFGGMRYPSLFSSHPSSYNKSTVIYFAQTLQKGGSTRINTTRDDHYGPTTMSRLSNTSYGGPSSSLDGLGSPVREEPPSYGSSVMQKHESFENPVRGNENQSFSEQDGAAENPQFGKALYDFTAGGDDELNLTTGEEVEIDYEVDGWYYVRKKRPGRDGKMAGLVPVLYCRERRKALFPTFFLFTPMDFINSGLVTTDEYHAKVPISNIKASFGRFTCTSFCIL